MESTEEILEIVRDIREDISYMKRHRNMLCGMPIREMFQAEWDVPVYLGNDANCAAIGQADNLRASASGGAFCSPPPRSRSSSSVRSWSTSDANS